MTFSLRTASRRRSISLTPMVDVVFLLLVFFMLASRFEQDVGIELSASLPGSGGGDAPRLVDVLAEGVLLNGVPTGDESLAEHLGPLVRDESDVVVLRPGEGADVQRLIDLIEALKSGGFSNLVVIE